MNPDIKKLLLAGIENAVKEYQWLKDYANSDKQLSQWVEARAMGKPLAYILGHVDFYGLNLIVNEHVLIPRFETEELVDIIVQRTSKDDIFNILDLGCGSGAIALALKKNLPKSNLFAIDFSMNALTVALANQAKYPELKIHWIHSHWLDAINLNNIDIIVSNPPYIEQNWHDPSINYEPKIALYSGMDGLEDIKAIIKQSCCFKHLHIWFEHGHKHDLAKIVGSSWNIEKLYDHSGSQRFTHLSCNKKNV
ncbi:MAG: peptide chain release factor N(5)-glutamine methyltransferase [Pseudomonadota bacterium]|nr:peptide chain release factor N(5)-glutamine methyltransferase [Pseudomonadota bacterium]